MRGVAAVAVIAAAAFAVPAIAQELGPIDVKVKVKVIPNKVGTPKHPQPIKVRLDAELIAEDLSFERPIVDHGTVLLGKGGVWNGGKFPKCTAEILNRRGLDACPKGSIFGHGYATGYADTVRTTPKITVVNGGAKEAYGYVQLTNPARVNVAVVTKIKKRTGKWSYQLDFKVPESLQIVAGVPISLTKLHLELGNKNILASTYCPPDGRWKYESTSTLVDGRQPSIKGSVGCRR
ncbi:MAG TPA: hypothetical protein VI111_08360 [Thermoleophilaceae bacterium]